MSAGRKGASNRPRCLMCEKTLKPNTVWIDRAPTAAELETYREIRAKYEAIDDDSRAAYNESRMDDRQREREKKLFDRQELAEMTRRLPGLRFWGDGSRITEHRPDGTFGIENFFHSGRCAQTFGILAARAGYRIKR